MAFAPEPDCDGVGLGTTEGEIPEPEVGNTFEVGTGGCDAGDVAASLDGGERGGRDGDAVEGPADGVVGTGMGAPLVDPGPDGTTGDGAIDGPLVGTPWEGLEAGRVPEGPGAGDPVGIPVDPGEIGTGDTGDDA